MADRLNKKRKSLHDLDNRQLEQLEENEEQVKSEENEEQSQAEATAEAEAGANAANFSPIVTEVLESGRIP